MFGNRLMFRIMLVYGTFVLIIDIMAPQYVGHDKLNTASHRNLSKLDTHFARRGSKESSMSCSHVSINNPESC